MHKNRTTLLLILISLMGFVQNLSAQVVGDYRSIASGNWKELSTWQIFTTAGWRAPTELEGVPKSSSGIVTISGNTKVVVSDTIIIDQLQILSGGNLNLTGDSYVTLNFTTGYDMAVYGTLELAGKLNLRGKISFYAASIFKCNVASWTFSNQVVSHPNALLEFGLGGETSLQYQSSVAMGRIAVKNNTHLRLSAVKDPVTLQVPNGSGTDLIVESGSTVSIESSIKSFIAMKSSLIEVNGTLKNFSLIDLSAELTKCVINGKMENGGQIPGNIASKLVFNPNCTYNHLSDGGSLPVASWAPTSSINLSDIKTTFPSGFNQSIGNLFFNSSITKDIAIPASLDINGSFTVEIPNDKKLLLNNSDSAHQTIFIANNFNLKSGNLVVSGSSGSGSVQIGGTFYQDGGNVYIKTGSGDAIIFVGQNLIKKAGFVYFRGADSTSTQGNSCIWVKGDFEHASGTMNFALSGGIGQLKIGGHFKNIGGLITETGTGKGIINFIGSDIQTFESTSIISNTIDFIVDSLAFLQMASTNTRATGIGTFTVQEGATIGIRSTAGVMLSPATTGNINTLYRVFKSGAHYVFNGTGNQNLGNAFTVSNPASITIDNPGIVYQTSDVVVTGDVKILQGELSTRNFHLKIAGNWMNNGKYNPNTSSQITFNGVKQQQVGGTQVTAFLTMLVDNPEGLSLQQNLQVNTQLTMLNGVVMANDYMLILGLNAKQIAGAPFSANKMIVMNEKSEVRKMANNSTQATYSFPIGNINAGKRYYSPIQFLFTGGTYLGFYNVKVIDAKHPQNPDPVNYLTRYWTVRQEGFKLFSAALTAEFDSSDITGSRDALRLSKYNETNTVPWTNFPVAPTGNSFYVAGITSFSDFTGFGNATTAKTTLRTINNSSGITATDSRTIKSGPPVMTVYPNPVIGRTVNLAFNNFNAGRYEMVITNNLGQRVLAQSVQHNGGNTTQKVQMPSGSKGVYRVQLNGEGENLISSFIIE